MNPARSVAVLSIAVVAWVGVAGCGGAKKKEITDLQRKQAAHHASEAQFALTVKDLPRAEASLVQAAELTPDDGSLWVSLGAIRIRQGKKDLAKRAYESALKAYEDEAKAQKTDAEPWLKQVYVLALLGRPDNARSLLERARKQFPNDRDVKLFIEGKQLERMLADPKIKEMAL